MFDHDSFIVALGLLMIGVIIVMVVLCSLGVLCAR
jgi:hypothetical protein